jgi:hypothetical protein
MALSDPQRFSLLSLFDSQEETIAVDWLVNALRRPSRGGYQHPERIVRDALEEGLLYVDSIGRDGTTFVGLTEDGESEWREDFEEK